MQPRKRGALWHGVLRGHRGEVLGVVEVWPTVLFWEELEDLKIALGTSKVNKSAKG